MSDHRKQMLQTCWIIMALTLGACWMSFRSEGQEANCTIECDDNEPTYTLNDGELLFPIGDESPALSFSGESLYVSDGEAWTYSPVSWVFMYENEEMVVVNQEQDAVVCDREGCICMRFTEEDAMVMERIQWKVAVAFIEKGETFCGEAK